MTKTKSIYLAFVAVLLSPMTANADLITAVSDPALAGSTLLDFELEAHGAFESRSFNGDVTFSSDDAYENLFVQSTYCATYGGSGTCLANPSGANFSFEFAAAVSAFGFTWGAADQSWTMNVYGAGDVLLESLAIAAQSTPFIGYLGSDAGSILRVSMTSYNGYDYILLDDFRYVAAQVPEPATLALFGLGLAGIGFSRRKKA